MRNILVGKQLLLFILMVKKSRRFLEKQNKNNKNKEREGNQKEYK